MPFKSEAQRKLFHAMADRNEISEGKVHEWEHATKNKASLPEHVKKSAAYEQGVKIALDEAGLSPTAPEAPHTVEDLQDKVKKLKKPASPPTNEKDMPSKSGKGCR